MPTPTAFPSVALGGPQWLRCQVVDKKWPTVTGPVYCDGGQDTFLSSPIPSQISWEIEYGGLEEWEISILDGHNDSVYDTHLGFDFTDPETGIAYENVKYLEYQRGQRPQKWNDRRLVKLIKRP